MTKEETKYTYQMKLDESSTRTTKKLVFPKLHSVNNPKSIHGIFPYRGKMSAIDAMEMIHQLPSKGTLLDPFCGSGTIAYESQKWGLNTIGVDNNPLAVLIAKAKTQPFDKNETLNLLRSIIDEASNLKSKTEIPEFAKQYFHEQTAVQIMSTLSMFNEMNHYLRAAFIGAIALTARACNHYKWSSNSIGKIITPLREINFFDIFDKKARKHMDSIEHNADCEIYEHDSRNLDSIIPKGSIDIVYTSPPYFDALDYTGYYGKIVYSILDKNRAEIRNGLIQKFSSYEEDMQKVLKQIEYVTKDSAIIIFVVGDKKTDAGIINGGEFFTNLSDWKPNYIVEREYTGSSSQIWDSINKTKRKEQVIVWDKLMQ